MKWSDFLVSVDKKRNGCHVPDGTSPWLWTTNKIRNNIYFGKNCIARYYGSRSIEFNSSSCFDPPAQKKPTSRLETISRPPRLPFPSVLRVKTPDSGLKHLTPDQSFTLTSQHIRLTH